MKKTMFIINLIIAASVAAATTCFAIFREDWIIYSIDLAVVLMAVTNIIFIAKSKTVKNKPFAYFVGIGLAVVVISNLFFEVSWLSVVMLMITSAIFYAVAAVLFKKFTVKDLIISIGFAIALSLTFSSTKIFGFNGFFGIILAVITGISLAVLLSKTLTNVVEEKNSTTVIMLIAAIVHTVATLFVYFAAYSHTPIAFEYILIGLNGLSLILFNFVLIVYLMKSSQIEEQMAAEEGKFDRISINSAIKIAVTMLISVFLAGYSMIMSFSNFTVATAKISKAEFFKMTDNSLDVPYIEISTENNEVPRSKEDYVNCSFVFRDSRFPSTNFIIPMAENYGDDGSVGIRLRGNSTMMAKKKPYRIKFDEKQSFFGLKANKSWVLLADFYDQSYIRNYTAFNIANIMDDEDEFFSPTGYHVAVVINDEFKGIYLLCEQMDENSGRTAVKPKEDIDPTSQTEFPFLVEMDLNAYKEGVTGIDNFYVDGYYPVEIKYPEADERGKTETEDKVFDYIKEYLSAVFETLSTGKTTTVSFRENPVSFEDLVDIESAAHYYLVTEIMLNPDSMWKSIYFHKTADGKMKFGPIWDYDYSMATDWQIPYEKSYIEAAESIYIAKNSIIYNKLINNENFYNLVQDRYFRNQESILELIDYLEYVKEMIDEVALIDAKMWRGKTGEFQYDSQFDYVRLFLRERQDYLNEVFAMSHTEFLEEISGKKIETA